MRSRQRLAADTLSDVWDIGQQGRAGNPERGIHYKSECMEDELKGKGIRRGIYLPCTDIHVRNWSHAVSLSLTLHYRSTSSCPAYFISPVRNGMTSTCMWWHSLVSIACMYSSLPHNLYRFLSKKTRHARLMASSERHSHMDGWWDFA